MSKVVHHLAVVLEQGQMMSWHLVVGKSPNRISIHGDKTAAINEAQDLTYGLNDVLANINGQDIQIAHIHWLADHKSCELLINEKLTAKIFGHSAKWQVLSLEWLAGRFARKTTELDEHFIEQQLLPWLVTSDDQAERNQMKVALAQEHQSEAEKLLQERASMQQENRRLQEQNAALRQVDKERMVTYLPALFSRVFTILGAADLALLCGSVEPLNIPNPFPEPSPEALRVLQRQFRRLPKAAQLEIVQLVQHLPHRQRLSVRSEMRELIVELEDANEY